MSRKQRPLSVIQAINDGDHELLSKLGRAGARKGSRKGGLVSGQRNSEDACWRHHFKCVISEEVEQRKIDEADEHRRLLGLDVDLNSDPDYGLLPLEG